MYVCMYMRTVVHGQELTVKEDLGVGQHLEQPSLDDTHLTTRCAEQQVRLEWDRAAH